MPPFVIYESVRVPIHGFASAEVRPAEHAVTLPAALEYDAEGSESPEPEAKAPRQKGCAELRPNLVCAGDRPTDRPSWIRLCTKERLVLVTMARWREAVVKIRGKHPDRRGIIQGPVRSSERHNAVDPANEPTMAVPRSHPERQPMILLGWLPERQKIGWQVCLHVHTSFHHGGCAYGTSNSLLLARELVGEQQQR